MSEDFSFLVQETFDFIDQNVLSMNTYQNLLSESPGVFYIIDKSLGTFVIRAYSSSNLLADFSDAVVREEILKKLKLDDLDEIGFFECEDLYLAEKIVESMAFKRFSISEEDIYNISDPGDSWWASCDESSITMYLGLNQTHILDDLIKLGPLGDPKDCIQLFNKLQGFFKLLCPVKEYVSFHGMIQIKSESDSEVFQDLKAIFIKGEVSSNILEKIRLLESSHPSEKMKKSLNTACYTLIEMATLRRFWIDIQFSL